MTLEGWSVVYPVDVFVTPSWSCPLYGISNRRSGQGFPWVGSTHLSKIFSHVHVSLSVQYESHTSSAVHLKGFETLHSYCYCSSFTSRYCSRTSKLLFLILKFDLWALCTNTTSVIFPPSLDSCIRHFYESCISHAYDVSIMPPFVILPSFDPGSRWFSITSSWWLKLPPTVCTIM